MENNEMESQVEVQRQQEEVDLGTFKSVKTLKEAYDSLRKTFTQNAMELAKLKKEDGKNNLEIKENAICELAQNLQDNDKNMQVSDENVLDSGKKLILSNDENKEKLKSDKVDFTPDNEVADKVGAPAELKFEGDEWQEQVRGFFTENVNARAFAKEIGSEIMQDKAIRESVDPLGRAWIKILEKQRNNGVNEQDFEEMALKNEKIKEKVINEYLGQLQKRGSPKLIAKPTPEVNASVTPKALNMEQAKELARKIMLK